MMEKAVVYLTDKAENKMRLLVTHFETEVAWYGSAKRLEGYAKYLIEDIMVYPQTVTGTFVDMDEGEFAKWLQENDDDPRFSHLYFQGHSHVRMGVQPSITDMECQEMMVNQLGSEDFYIFAILNKYGKENYFVHDMKYMTSWFRNEVMIDYAPNHEGEQFLREAEKLVRKKGET